MTKVLFTFYLTEELRYTIRKLVKDKKYPSMTAFACEALVEKLAEES